MPRTAAPPVDPSNAQSLAAWDGHDGVYWTEQEAIFDHSLARYMPAFFAGAAIVPSDRVLDIGCGTGETTREAARRAPEGSALGVDLSSRMIERARDRTREQGLTNARFVQADAQVHPFDEHSFDLVISRTGVMFFGDPVAALSNIRRAVGPDGRLVLLVWQPPDRNHWFRDFSAALAQGRERPAPPPEAPGPFSWSDPERVDTILAAAGFVDVACDPLAELMWFGDTGATAFAFVRGLGFTDFMLNELDDDARAQALTDLRATIDAHATDEGVLYPSAAWLVTAHAKGGGEG